MKSYLLVVSLLCLSKVFGQSMSEGEKMFNNYEYQRAYSIYKSLYATEEFQTEDLKRFAYSSFVIGEFQTSYNLLPRLLESENIEPYFSYMKGEVCMHLKKYGEAKQAYLNYQQLDDEYNVSVKIQSCDLINSWTDQEHIEVKNLDRNDSKADFCGVKTPYGRIEYHEEGVDSSGNEITKERIDYSELVVLKPFITDSNGVLHRLMIDEKFKYGSISSIAIHAATGIAYLTISEPISADLFKLAPHIYTGTWDSENYSILSITPWVNGGFSDSTACAHLSISENGKYMAFSKMQNDQSDIFTSQFNDNLWSVATPLTAVNTSLNEMYPLFLGDTMLSFSSDGRPGYGNLDVYTYNLTSQAINHLKSPVNGPMDDFNFIYESADSALFVSNRFGGKGDDDAYEIVFRRFIPEPVVEPDSSDYFAFFENWVDQKIYFDFDKFNLKRDVKIIDELVVLLAKYPTVSINLEAHADKRGEVGYNDVLSQKRAETVQSELEKLGISKSQITIQAKGEKEPIVDCVKCSDEIYAANRVVIITLKK
ncbi:MAG: OmpA family protein [Crocinitomicaceae bacterium]|nr:MAG: OmpA family protein [Crocinitomicaceae bacterium]